MNAIVNRLTEVGDLFLPMLQQQLLYSSVIFVAVLLLSISLRKRASLLHLGLWTLVLFRLVLPIDFSFDFSARGLVDRLFPTPAEPILINSTPVPGTTATLHSESLHSLPQINTVELIDQFPQQTINEKPARLFPWTFLILSLWMVGFTFFSFLYLFRLVNYNRIQKHAKYIVDRQTLAIVRRWRTHFKIKREIDILSSDSARSPFTLGIFHPVVILPRQMIEQFTPAKLEAVIAHECAHIKNLDDLWIKLQNVIQIFYFFHPLLWIVNNRIHLYRECLCDEMVLGTQSVSINDYGQGLLDTLRSNFLSVAHTDFIAGFGSPKNKLMFRIRNMKKQKSSSWLNRILMLSLVVALGVFMLPMSECTQSEKNEQIRKDSTKVTDSSLSSNDITAMFLDFVERVGDKRIVSAPIEGRITRIRSIENQRLSKKIYLRSARKQIIVLSADSTELRLFVSEGDSVIKGQKLYETTGNGFCYHGIDFHWPIERNQYRFIARYGERVHPTNGEKHFHDGIDLAAPRGTPVRAAASGTVVETVYDYKKNRGYGRLVVIEHNGDYKTRYCHLHSFNVREGQLVEAGQIIGHVGSTGKSTAPHLHFELYEAGELVNPVYYLGEKEPDILEEHLIRPGFIRPVEKSLSSVSRTYGLHIHPTIGVEAFHDGVDFKAPLGTAIVASAPGTVEKVVQQYRPNHSFGKYVVLSHGSTYQTRYAHMQSINVEEGQRVEQGEVIGKVGSTGRSTAPHVHFEIYKGDRTIDPARFMEIEEPDQRTRTESETTIFKNLDLFSNSVDIQPPIGFNEIDTVVQFGSYFHSVTGMEQSNYGIEIRAKRGTPVYAAAQGMVIKTVPQFRPQQLYGKHIIIEHADGYQTRYAHLNTIDVTEGDSVEQGQLIGHVGTTGWTYQPHLHFSLFFDNTLVDPQPYFAESLSKKTVLPADSSTINKPRFYHALWENYKIIGMFGWRIDPKSNQREFHEAVDFAVPVGTPVHAIANGIVREAESIADSSGARYNRISIEHPHAKITSRYLYLGDMFVHPGQKVDIGQVIAEVGPKDEGDSFLSVQILVNGTARNPLWYLELFSAKNFSSI